MNGATGNFLKAIGLGAWSSIALIAGASESAFAQQQSPDLPAIHIEEPRRTTHRARPARRAVAARHSRASRQAVVRPAGTVSPTIVQRASNPNSTMTLMPPYAGGQVATGGRVGILGNRSVMDTPFNQTSYTSKLIQDQQAQTLDDVLANDPSVISVYPRRSAMNQVYFRGFPGGGNYGEGFSVNGLPSMGGGFTQLTPMIERVEVFKGPSALLNGMPPSGSVGGTINLVTKRAGDEPLTQLTTSYISRSQFGSQIDVGRRYGPNNEFGIRFNGAYSNGDTPVSPESAEHGVGALNLDYRGERVRLSADYFNQMDNLQPYAQPLGVTALTTVPVPPDASRSLLPDWAYTKNSSQTAMVRGEVDLSDNVTAYAAAGERRYERNLLLVNFLNALNSNGSYSANTVPQQIIIHNQSAEAGIRANLTTGLINHALNFNYTTTEQRLGSSQGAGVSRISNIYNPSLGPLPYFAPLAPAQDSTVVSSSGVGIADTMSAFDGRIQFTAGVRRQQAASVLLARPDLNYDAYAWSPAYALVVKPWQNVSLYANYIEGLEQGTLVGNTFANFGDVFPPYQSKQEEAGVKVDWGKTITTLSFFQIARPSTISIPGTPLPTLALDGEQVNRGIELNVFGELTPELRLLSGVTFLDARLTKTQGGVRDGRRAQGAPAVRAILGAEWDTPFLRGLTISGRATWSDWQYASNTSDTLIIPSWTQVDLGARYTFDAPWNGKPVTIRFNVDNVFNKNYWVSGFNGMLALSEPRTYRLSTTFNF